MRNNNYLESINKIITEQSSQCHNRALVFDDINRFIDQFDNGYFILTGIPGSGKTTILAKYAKDHNLISFFPNPEQAKYSTKDCLRHLLTEIINKYNLDYQINDLDLENGKLFGIILQKISELLPEGDRLILVIDAIDLVEMNQQSQGSNILYLPRYLPRNIYFILSSRPLYISKYRLLFEVPYRFKDLKDYRDEDEIFLIDHIKSLLFPPNDPINMRYIMLLLAGRIDELEQIYNQDWENLKNRIDNEEDLDKIIKIFVDQPNFISRDDLIQQTNLTKYQVEKVLEELWDFLQTDKKDRKLSYRLYHSSFRTFLKKKLNQ